MRSSSTAAGIVLGYAADLCFADPRRNHPVAGFGRAASWLRGKIYADSRPVGAAYTTICVSAAAGLGLLAEHATRRHPLAKTAATALATWAVLGGTSLRREAAMIGGALEASDLGAARDRLPHLCGRDPSGLDLDQIARAVVESVAENTSDAVAAPLFWGAVAGIPGLLGYRAANTLDAMVGYRDERYLRFGWASARFDDVLNWIPARFTGVVTVAVAPVVGGSRRETYDILRRDGASHPSPNAGRCEASAAGALGIRLGGSNTYGEVVEHRPVMGRGRPPRVADIRRVSKLSAAVGSMSAAAAAVVAARLHGRLG